MREHKFGIDSSIENFPTSELEQFCSSLKILSNPNRLRILAYLLEQEASVGDLEKMLNIKQPNLSHELRKLREKQFVKTRRQSKVIFYSIADVDQRMIGSILDLLNPTQDTAAEINKQASRAIRVSERKERTGECAHFAIVA